MVVDNGDNFALRQPQWLHCLVYLMIGYKLVEWLIKKKKKWEKKQRQPSKDTRLYPKDNFNSEVAKELQNAARSQKSLQSGVQQKAMTLWSSVEPRGFLVWFWFVRVFLGGGRGGVGVSSFFTFLLIKAVSSFLLQNSQFLLFPLSTQAKKEELKLAPFSCMLTWSNSSSS